MSESLFCQSAQSHTRAASKTTADIIFEIARIMRMLVSSQFFAQTDDGLYHPLELAHEVMGQPSTVGRITHLYEIQLPSVHVPSSLRCIIAISKLQSWRT